MSLRKISIAALSALLLFSLSSFSQDNFDEFEDFEFDDAEVQNVDSSSEGFEDFDDFEVSDDFGGEEDLFEEFDQAEAAESSEIEEAQAQEVIEVEPADIEPIEDIEPLITEEDSTEEPLLEEFQEEPAVDDTEDNFFVDSEPENTIPANDEPDYALESELHRIYVDFYAEETSADQWSALSSGRQSEVYSIQSGDTLWDISQTLFGDGNYWPKVWSLNTRITNPHQVSPGNEIQFLLGNESMPPSFTVTESGAVMAPITQSGSNVEPMQTDDSVDLPPPAIKSRPVVKKLPPSFPKWQDLSSLGEYDDLGIDYGKRKIADLKDRIVLGSYITEVEPTAFGEISEVEAGSRIASPLQYVYVTMKQGQAEVGDTFLSIKNTGAVESVTKTISGFLGYSIEVQGEVQLVERVSVNRSNSTDESFRAIVTQIINPVTVGGELIEGRLQNISLEEKGQKSQVVAQVIGGQHFNRRQVYGAESITYLNKGSRHGLTNGQLLSVRENRAIRNPNTNVNENVRPIGWLKVVRTTPNFSTAIVVRSWSDILTGDLTGAGSFTKDLEAQNQKVEASELTGQLSDEFSDSGEDSDESANFDEEFGEDEPESDIQ